MSKCLGPFSVSVIKEGVYKSLDEETTRIQDQLTDVVHGSVSIIISLTVIMGLCLMIKNI